MKILVLTANIGSLSYSEYTLPLIKKWCERKGYDLSVETRKPVIELDNRHITWSKIIFILKTIRRKEYDAIFWIDLDAVPLDMNYDLIELLENNLSSEIIISGDLILKNNNMRFDINSGLMLIRCSGWTEKFFDLIMNNVYYAKYKTEYWHEQTAIELAINDFKNIDAKSKVKILKNPTLTDYYNNVCGDALSDFDYTKLKAPFFHNYGKKKDKLCEISKYIRNL